MNMSRNYSRKDLNDGPHTLRSGLHSPEISILRPSHHSLSLISSSLEISQSPTRAIIQEPHKSQYSDLDTQNPCTTSSSCTDNVHCKPAPPEIPTYPCTTIQEEMSQYPSHLASEKIEEAASEDKNTNGQVVMHRSQTFPSAPKPYPPELLHEPSPEVTTYKSNPLSKPTPHSSCNLVPGPNIASSSDMLPSPAYCISDKFFSFVIFHAPKDQETATRVCNDLEHLGVGRGTTFCEGFETPGVSPLNCLEDAVENSAYIVLLLTNAFLETTWIGFQSTTAMMNSIQNAEKQWTVIPFYPKLNKPDGKIPIWIQNLLALDENSPLFTKKVYKTFRKDVIEKQYQCWRRRMIKGSTDLLYLQQQQNISLQWSMGDAAAVLPQQTQPLHSVFHGQAPVIQISHAANVQIGNQNCMNVQASPNVPQMDSDTNIFQDAENETLDFKI